MSYGTINAVNASAEATSYNNANTSSIITSDNVQGAIDQLFQSVSEGKSLIAGALTDKGISTSASDSWQTIAGNISNMGSRVATGTVDGTNQPTLTVNNVPFTPSNCVVVLQPTATNFFSTSNYNTICYISSLSNLGLCLYEDTLSSIINFSINYTTNGFTIRTNGYVFNLITASVYRWIAWN